MDVTQQPLPVRRLEPGASLAVRPSRLELADFEEISVAGRLSTALHEGDRSRPAERTNGEDGTVGSFVSSPVEDRGQVATVDRMKVEDVTISYGGKPAVRSVSLPVRQGEVLALIGPSGCGKTTLLRSLNRLTELTKSASLSGRITLDGADISQFEATRSAPPGHDGVPAAQPVSDEHLRQRRLRAPRAGPPPTAQGRSAASGRGGTVSGRPAGGGQGQPRSYRLCASPAASSNGSASLVRWRRIRRVLLLDEPCSALDPQSSAVIEDLIVKLREEVAIVIVTHNLQQAHRVGDHVAFMYLGELVEYQDRHEALLAPASEQRTREYVSGRVRLSAAEIERPFERWWLLAPQRSWSYSPAAPPRNTRPRGCRLDAARLRSAIAGTRVKTQAAAGVRPSSIRDGHGRGLGRIRGDRSQPRDEGRHRPADIGRLHKRPRGHASTLNAGTDLEYFQAHLPAIQAGGSLNWVYTATRRIPAGAQPFAL